MSLYRDYKKERENKEVLETDEYFVVYSFGPDSIYVEDVYLVPSVRSSGLIRELMDHMVEIGRAHGKKFLVGSASEITNGWEKSVGMMKHYGMVLHKKDGYMVFYVKEI